MNTCEYSCQRWTRTARKIAFAHGEEFTDCKGINIQPERLSQLVPAKVNASMK